MRRITRQRRVWVVAGAAMMVCAAGVRALAQGVTAPPLPTASRGASPRWPARSRTEIELAVFPQAPGKPALAYGLIPGAQEMVAGNGAMKFLEAFAQMPQLSAEESTLLDSAKSDAPLAELDANDPQIKALRGKFDACLKLLREGARMESVDWGTATSIREKGVTALLPSLSKARQAAWALALEARFDIKSHNWKAAQDKLETGYRLARSMTTSATIIEVLVGVAIAGQMDRCLEDWVSEAGAPNLYWPLVNLPMPFADIPHALGYERAIAYFSLPQFREIEEGHYSPELWTGLVSNMSDLSHLTAQVGGEGALPGGTGLEQWKNQVVSTAFGIALYPQAKAYFRQAGMSAEQVEKMPVAEAIERYFVETYNAEADELFKWKGLPPLEAVKGMAGEEKAFAARFPTERNLLARILLPSLSRAMTIQLRGDRQIAMLRVVEAIRAYAAEKGALPGKLEELTLPVPKDPTTGEAFVYSVNGEAAVLNSPSSEKNGGLRYEIRLRK